LRKKRRRKRKRKPKMVTTPSDHSSSLRTLLRFHRTWFLVPVFCFLGVGLGTTLVASVLAYGEQKPEEPYALIYGTVFGPDNHSVYGVKVKIRRADQKKAKWELYSDHSGEFAQRVPAGKADYVVWPDLKGCNTPQCKGLRAGTEVTIHIQNDERADIGLHLSK
jgi:hypothetical protein